MLVTDRAGHAFETQQYYAYGRPRGGGALPTDFTFTGQKVDGTGLMYYRARYYDPVIGQFISPDTIVPDATSVLDYNRYMMVRGNPLKYNDPTGHFVNLAAAAVGAGVGFAGSVVWQTAVGLYNQSKNGESISLRNAVSDISWSQAAGAAVAGGITGITMGAGSAWAAAYLMPSTGNAVMAGVISGAAGGALGGQVGIGTTAIIDELNSSDGFQFSEATKNAQDNGLGSLQQVVVDGTIGGISGGIGAAAGQWISPKLVDWKLRDGYHYSPRTIPTMGGSRPHVYLYEATPAQELLGTAITVGLDVTIDTIIGQGGSVAGCQLAGCPH